MQTLILLILAEQRKEYDKTNRFVQSIELTERPVEYKNRWLYFIYSKKHIDSSQFFISFPFYFLSFLPSWLADGKVKKNMLLLIAIAKVVWFFMSKSFDHDKNEYESRIIWNEENKK